MGERRDRHRSSKRPQGATQRARGRPRDPQKREAIVRAAERLLFAADPQLLRMERIAQEAGVSKATLYAYFPNLNAVLRAVIQNHRATMTAALDRSPRHTADVRAALVEFGDALLDFITGKEALAVQRMLAADPVLRRRVGSLIYREGPAAMRSKVAQWIDLARIRGDLRIGDPERAAEQLLGMWQGTLTVALLMGARPRPSAAERRRIVREAVDVWLRAHAPV
ncbi:MAG: transcriptional regulator [Candidatus Binatia bacterium]|nr:MAG: transcriptional regulator [Candidatus Binatia bacterium]